MITTILQSPNCPDKTKGDKLFIIIEPSDLQEMLEFGTPIQLHTEAFAAMVVSLEDTVIYVDYTPDAEWLQVALMQPGAKIGELMIEGKSRRPVYRGRPTGPMERVGP